MKILYQLTSPMERTALGREEVERRKSLLNAYAVPGCEVEVRSLPRGPASIESAYDAALVVPELLRAVADAEEEAFDAVIVGCFSDPGLDAARELVTGPVIGPGAASFHLAAQLGTRIAVIAPLEGSGGRAAARMRALGLDEAVFAAVRGMGMSVLDLARQREAALDRIADAGRRAAVEAGADVLVLGCMSMAFLEITEELQSRIGLPVVNPVMAALKTAEAMVFMNLTHSKTAYPTPPKKEVL
jgi:allantoin racemase